MLTEKMKKKNKQDNVEYKFIECLPVAGCTPQPIPDSFCTSPPPPLLASSHNFYLSVEKCLQVGRRQQRMDIVHHI